ncbi:hypothetical protein NV379_00400 [Paenibacillus sp. N1-5-1-14]|uniref:hypothetical protein n=1 Tax=Paenibacillus radicibacter TaxID=2972488 RepID=UPI0021590720|nr:hypothetical protein [Paenibacillus radicibacter]MCR8641102.1 hypothetical protein [Paenibacillus radicibacter]
MTLEHKIRENLLKEAEQMECPPAISNRIKQSYSQYAQPKRRETTMKKRLIGGIVAAALLIPTAAFAAPTLYDMIKRTPMTAEQVKADEVGNATLEKLYKAYPETKSFEIIDASNAKGDVLKPANPDDATQLKVNQTSIILQEKGGKGKKITLHTNGITGDIEHVNQENWEPASKPVINLSEKEIKAKVDDLINKMYGNAKVYEFAMEQMENPDNKVWMLNYSIKGAEAPFFQVFVHDNAIDLMRVGGEPVQKNIKVEGLFTRDGKPDHTYDSILNDDKLFALLKITPQQLKEELAKGKSVAEIAASKNISKQQVYDVIANTQVDIQLEAEKNGVVPNNNRSKEQMLKEISPKLAPILDHKNVTTKKK